MAEDNVPGRRGMICIYRMQDAAVAGSHEDSAHVQKVEFGPGARKPNTSTFRAQDYLPETDAAVLRAFTCGPERREVENPAPLLDASRRPDISYGGAPYTITLNFPMKSNIYGEQPPTLKQLIMWDQTNSTIKGKFPNGRYGIRNDILPFLDCEPDATAGYQLTSVKPNWDLAFDSFVPVTLTLHHVGESSRLNTGRYLRTITGPSMAPVYTYSREGGAGRLGVRP